MNYLFDDSLGDEQSDDLRIRILRRAHEQIFSMSEDDARFVRDVFNSRPTIYYSNDEEAEAKGIYEKTRAILKELRLPADPVELLMMDREEVCRV